MSKFDHTVNTSIQQAVETTIQDAVEMKYTRQIIIEFILDQWGYDVYVTPEMCHIQKGGIHSHSAPTFHEAIAWIFEQVKTNE